jgi:hypothetical protein
MYVKCFHRNMIVTHFALHLNHLALRVSDFAICFGRLAHTYEIT